MISIEKYIEKLLLKHDCVIIPNLGGFVTSYEPSYFDEESGLLYPPTRTIGFNSRLNINDGLLVQAYMQAYDTNFPEANRIVERETENIWEQLRQNGSYVFENIGSLELNANNTILFTPKNDSGIVDPDLYGLDAIKPEPYQVANVVEEVPAVAPAPLPAPFTPAEDEDETMEDEPRHYIIRLNKSVAHYAAAVVLAVIFYLAFPVPLANHSQNDLCQLSSENGAFYGFPIKAVIEEALANRQALKQQPASEVKQESVALNAPAEEVTPAAEPEDAPALTETEAPQVQPSTSYYTIVLASSIKMKNAEIFVEQLQKEGLTEAHVWERNKMLRVVYSQYPTEEEALQARRQLMAEHPCMENAWILLVK